MKKEPGLRVRIYQLIKEKRGQKVHNGDIQRFTDLQGYLSSNGDRRARDLVEEFRNVKGVREPNPYYCPDVKSAIENGSAVYWYEEKEPSKDPSNYRCSKCNKDAVTLSSKIPFCQKHLVNSSTPVSLF